jgi:DNA repair exonuclease SbcCD nuclease subunit
VVHASFEIPDVTEDTYVVTAAQVDACGLDYLALGHLHSLSDRSRGAVRAYYPGSPEMVRMQKGEFGNVLLVELDDGVRVTPVEVGRRVFEEVTVSVEDVESAAALKGALESHAGPDKILKLNVEGLRRPGYPDMEGLTEEISGLFFHVITNDRSSPAPATVDPGAYPGDSPAGVYLRILHSRLAGCPAPLTEEVLEAMQVGLSLLEEEGR